MSWFWINWLWSVRPSKTWNKPWVLQNEDVILTLARDKFSIDPWVEVYLVLEEDGTEVDDEEYFQVSHNDDDVYEDDGVGFVTKC